jgi:hypothetical protein
MGEMRLKELFLVTAVAEAVIGLALLGLPAIVLATLLGIQPATMETLFVGRIAGAALLAIGVASFLARNDATLPAQRGLLTGILLYDVLVALLLVYAGVGQQMAGPALWPAVVVHTLLAIWCVLSLRVQAEPGPQEGTRT